MVTSPCWDTTVRQPGSGRELRPEKICHLGVNVQPVEQPRADARLSSYGVPGEPELPEVTCNRTGVLKRASGA